jgi:hypothetical protein
MAGATQVGVREDHLESYTGGTEARRPSRRPLP